MSCVTCDYFEPSYMEMDHVTRAVIGVDVGGTNTDAVILDKSGGKIKIIAQTKTETTSDVTTGVHRAIHLALIACRQKTSSLAVYQVNIGTTHFINAVVEGRDLAKVSVIRLCGTSSRKLIPFSDFPENFSKSICGSIFLLNGGYQFDGKEITNLDEQEVINCIDILKANNEKNIVVSGVFSPVRNDQEKRVIELLKKRFPEASITSSAEIGKLGLLERENAAILNECIKPLCSQTIKGFREALNKLGLRCPMYLTQNDGTVLSEEKALKFPVFCCASGATNSMRGAAFLSGLKEAVVVDIGGTSTDVGLLLKGFPREASAEVKILGIRTNFRMPDVISIGLGGGSYVKRSSGDKEVRVGPLSAGYRIRQEALVFAQPGEIADRFVTATDVAVSAGICDVAGLKSNVRHLERKLVEDAIDKIHSMVSACVDEMRFNDRQLPLLLVGGGSIILNKEKHFDGVSQVIVPPHYDVANAIGAALSQISAVKEVVVNLENYLNDMDSGVNANDSCCPNEESSRKERLERARETAVSEIIEATEKDVVSAGADQNTVTIVEKEDITLSYIPGNAAKMRVKLVGDLKITETFDTFLVPETVFKQEPVVGKQTHKQTVSNTGVILTGEEVKVTIQAPNIDNNTGEWLLSEYDIECLHIGAGLLGCGGGGNPHVARLIALKALRSGLRMRVMTPSRFLKNADPENHLITMVALMGAPLIMYEKLLSGNESVGALQCLKDLYRIGNYSDEQLCNTEGVEIKTGEGVTFIDNYNVKGKSDSSDNTTLLGKKEIVAMISAEIGGINCIEPLIVAAQLNLPVLDCDGMGRAFPELQMFGPFIYGSTCYPACIVDDKGRRAVALKVDSPKRLEDHFRKVVIEMGCSGGVTLSSFTKDEILHKTVLHSLSRAWRLGDTVLKARAENRSAVDAVLKCEKGKLLIYGKIQKIMRETTGGFNKGKFVIEGLEAFEGRTVCVDFQNEFLVAMEIRDGRKQLLACVPDLITLMDPETAQPIPTEEIRFGIRASIVAIRAPELLSTEQALKFVGPQAFGYDEEVKYTPLCDPVECPPIAPL